MLPPNPNRLGQAILQTIAYADIFNSPMSRADLHRYLIEHKASPEDVDAMLQSELLPTGVVENTYGWLHLPERATLAERAEANRSRTHAMLQQAYRYAGWIAALPFVRMVALTGSLANHNVTASQTDIDFLIVTQPGFLWLVRAMILGLTRLTAPIGGRICPNFLLTTDKLALDDRGLYPAQELVRMQPLAGMSVYEQMRTANAWALNYLPNASGPPVTSLTPITTRHPVQWLGEIALNSPIGRHVERWEMRRKIPMLISQPSSESETIFGPDICKGHFEGHAARITTAWTERLKSLGLDSQIRRTHSP